MRSSFFNRIQKSSTWVRQHPPSVASQSFRFYTNKIHRTKQLQVELKKINPNPKKILETSYLVSNELGWTDILSKFKKPALNPHSNCLLFTGESHLLSILPELLKQAKTIIVNDVDLEVQTNVQLMLYLIKKNSREDYIQKYYNLTKEITSEGAVPASYHYEVTKHLREAALGKFDFLHSCKRYQICQQAAKVANVVYSHCDLFDVAHTSELCKVIDKHGLNLSIMNISNIRNYDEYNYLSDSLAVFSRHQPLILHSAHVDHFNGCKALPPTPFADFLKELNNTNKRFPLLPRFSNSY